MLPRATTGRMEAVDATGAEHDTRANSAHATT
jgi:hypothetical protein